jgi:hypothetical protein
MSNDPANGGGFVAQVGSTVTHGYFHLVRSVIIIACRCSLLSIFIMTSFRAPARSEISRSTVAGWMPTSPACGNRGKELMLLLGPREVLHLIGATVCWTRTYALLRHQKVVQSVQSDSLSEIRGGWSRDRHEDTLLTRPD